MSPAESSCPELWTELSEKSSLASRFPQSLTRAYHPLPSWPSTFPFFLRLSLSFSFLFLREWLSQKDHLPRDGTIECPQGSRGTIFRYPHGANLIPFESSFFSPLGISRHLLLYSFFTLSSISPFFFISRMMTRYDCVPGSYRQISRCLRDSGGF